MAKIWINHHFGFAVALDEEVLISYELDSDDNINYYSKGILDSVHEDLKDDIEQTLKISLSDFNIGILTDQNNIMNTDFWVSKGR